MQAVVLAAGLVLGAVALAAMNGLKAGTKAVGNGLKAIGKKLGSLLPVLSARSLALSSDRLDRFSPSSVNTLGC